MHRAPGGRAHTLARGGEREVLHSLLLRRVALVSDRMIQSGLQAADPSVYPLNGDQDTGSLLVKAHGPASPVIEVEAGYALHRIALPHQRLRDGLAMIRLRCAAEAEAFDLLRRQPAGDTQMLPVRRRQRQHGKQRGIGAVHLQRRRTVCLWFLLWHGRRFHVTVRYRSAVGKQCLTDFLIRLGIADAVYFRIQRQHPAALAAVIAAPDVFGEVQVQLAPLVSAKRAVRIDGAGTSPPDVQAEKRGDIHDVKGEIVFTHRDDSFLSHDL